MRLDQGLTNYAAQFFDVNTLETMGTTSWAVDTDPASPWTKAVLEGWWNRTNFTGSITDSKRDPNFPVIQRVEYSLDQEIGGVNTVFGNTLGDNTSAGSRAVFLFGDENDTYLHRADFHFQQNGLREDFDVENVIPPLSLGKFTTNLPFASMQDEGVFAEYGFPMMDGWDVVLGGRVDWVNTNVDFSQVRGHEFRRRCPESERHFVFVLPYEQIQAQYRLDSQRRLWLCTDSAVAHRMLCRRNVSGLLQSGFSCA